MAERSGRALSTTDPDARVMKMADGGFRPAYNIQFATDTGAQVVVGVDVSNAGSDRGQLAPMVAQVEQRHPQPPDAMLVDGGFATLADIETVSPRTITSGPCSRSRRGDSFTGSHMVRVPLFAAFLVALLLAPPPGASAQTKDDTLVYALQSDIDNWDPPNSVLREAIILGYHVFDHLAARDVKTGKVGPSLATSWRALDDTSWERAPTGGARSRSPPMRTYVAHQLVQMVVVIVGISLLLFAVLHVTFLGLGIQPPTPAWGNMLGEGRVYMLNSWWIAAFPGLAIFVTTLAINLMGNALRDWLDPHMKQ